MQQILIKQNMMTITSNNSYVSNNYVYVCLCKEILTFNISKKLIKRYILSREESII